MARIAVFDLGTVTFRLGVFDVSNQSIQATVFKDLRICNLGQGVDSSGVLSKDAIDRVLVCAKDFIDEALPYTPDICICTLTSAARDAANATDLLEGLRALGIEPQVIPGAIEGKLTFLGVAQDYPSKKIAVMDCGGGSTELCFGTMQANKLVIDWVHSYDVGARRVSERYALSNNEDEYDEAFRHISSIIRQDIPSIDVSQYRLIGVGGTATSLSAIHQELEVYDPDMVHGSIITHDELTEIARDLSCMTENERENVVGLQPQRASIIVGGLCTIDALMTAFKYSSLIVSESDILCGLAIVADSSFKYEENVVEWNPQLFNL